MGSLELVDDLAVFIDIAYSGKELNDFDHVTSQGHVYQQYLVCYVDQIFVHTHKNVSLNKHTYKDICAFKMKVRMLYDLRSFDGIPNIIQQCCIVHFS